MPKCAHIKADGIRCGSPALRGRQFCYFHYHNADHRPRRQTRSVNIPFPEDATSVQVGLYNVMLAIIDRRIDERRAQQLLWALQTAASQSEKLPFERFLRMAESVTELPDYEIAQQPGRRRRSSPPRRSRRQHRSPTCCPTPRSAAGR